MNIEDLLLVLALVVAFAITGTMDAADAELSDSAINNHFGALTDD